MIKNKIFSRAVEDNPNDAKLEEDTVNKLETHMTQFEENINSIKADLSGIVVDNEPSSSSS